MNVNQECSRGNERKRVIETCNGWTFRVVLVPPDRRITKQERLRNVEVKFSDFLLCEKKS